MSTTIGATLGVSFSLVPLPNHPVGRYSLFSNLRRRGVTVEQISVAYLLPVITVQRYLDLDRVEGTLLAKYRAGKLTAGQISVLGWIDDKTLQMRIYLHLTKDGKTIDGIEGMVALLRNQFDLMPKR